MSILGITNCHVIEYPSKRWGFVGRVPAELCETRKATTADVMGGRSFRGKNDELLTSKVKSFDTEAEARAFAKEKGVELAN